MPTFTMKEFIQAHKLNVDPRDAGATRLIAKRLKGAGYRRVKRHRKGKNEYVWTNENDARLKTLAERLAEIKF